MGGENTRRPSSPQAGQGDPSHGTSFGGVKMDKRMNSSEAPDPHRSDDVAEVGGSPHFEFHPGRPAFLNPSRERSGRGAGDGDAIPRPDSRPDQLAHAHSHAIYGGLTDDQNAFRRTLRRHTLLCTQP